MTQKDEEGKAEFTYYDEDIEFKTQWQAHKDAINYITWVPDLQTVASCSFDCNVFVWGAAEDGKTMEKKGSLVLGNRVNQEDKSSRRKHVKWLINIDKETRFKKELKEATSLLREVESMDYQQMKEDADNKLKLAEKGDPSMSPLDKQLGLTPEAMRAMKAFDNQKMPDDDAILNKL